MWLCWCARHRGPADKRIARRGRTRAWHRDRTKNELRAWSGCREPASPASSARRDVTIPHHLFFVLADFSGYIRILSGHYPDSIRIVTDICNRPMQWTQLQQLCPNRKQHCPHKKPKLYKQAALQLGPPPSLSICCRRRRRASARSSCMASATASPSCASA